MRHVLAIGNTDIPYDIRYSKNAAQKRIEVTPAGVEVIVPEGTALEGNSGLLAFVNKKRRWVFDSLREVREKQLKLLSQRYGSGAKIQYRGRWLMLDVQAVEIDAVTVQCRSKFHVRTPMCTDDVERLNLVKTGLEAWLRKRAHRDLQRFGRIHERGLGLRAEGYRLSDAKSRWGSCGRDGVIRVHWRLVQAPLAAFEYVVAHEVAHLVHRHHGVEFWDTLASTLPDWAERKAMLERWEGEHRAVLGERQWVCRGAAVSSLNLGTRWTRGTLRSQLRNLANAVLFSSSWISTRELTPFLCVHADGSRSVRGGSLFLWPLFRT